MTFTHFVRSITVSLLFCVVICGQQTANSSPTESAEEKARAELEKKAFALAEQIASDAAVLKLPENRAFVSAWAADLLWKQDAKRARQLFRFAADELILANNENEDDETDSSRDYYRSPRYTMLQMLAKHDADLALELLVRTRPPQLAAEMQRLYGGEIQANLEGESSGITGAKLVSPADLKWQAREELQLEQSFATAAAAQNPSRAVKLIRDSMAKGVSPEVFNLLRKLHEKDAELANELAAEVGQKLLDGDFSKREYERQIATSFISQFTKTPAKKDESKPPLKIEDKLLRDLANKIADGMLKSANYTTLWELAYVMPVIEKIAPERITALRQKQAALRKTLPPEAQEHEALNALIQSDASPEALFAEAAKMPAHLRSGIYHRALEKLIEKGEPERARQMLNELKANKDRDAMLAYIDSKIVEKAIKDGEFDEARSLINKLKMKGSKAGQLVALALAFHAKNDKESKQAALKLMDEARTLIDLTPGSEPEVYDLMRVIAGYAIIEPARAFTLLEPLVDEMNELLYAGAILAKFQKHNGVFKKGEMILPVGFEQSGMIFINFQKELGLLAAADFDRARLLTEKLNRTDARILARLIMLRSLLQENKEFN